MPRLPAVAGWPKMTTLEPLVTKGADDLAEGERHDRDVVAAEDAASGGR